MAFITEKEKYPECDWEWRSVDHENNSTTRAQWFCRRIMCPSCKKRLDDKRETVVIEMNGKQDKQEKFKCESCAKLYAEGKHMQRYTRKVAGDNKRLMLANARLVKILDRMLEHFLYEEELEEDSAE